MNVIRASRSRFHTFAVLSLVAMLLLAACQPIQPMPEDAAGAPAEATAMPAAEATAEPAAEAAGELPTLTVELGADGIVVPAEVPAGPTVVTLVNSAGTTGEDGSPILPEVGRLVEGATLDDLMGAMAEALENPAPALALIKIYGFPFAGDGQVIWDLVAGEHVALTTDGSTTPVTFTVVEGEAAAAPEADVQVELADFSFLMPDEIEAGPHLWELTNNGEQWHELVVITLAEGATVEDIFAFFGNPNPEGPPPMELMAGYSPFSEGNRVWFEVDLEPGEYTVICFIPDLLGDMAPHAMHGMVRTLVVN